MEPGSSPRRESPPPDCLCAREPPTLPSDIPLTGMITQFDDGSRWKLTAPLSERKYQQTNPPFEARQVYACVCIEDPTGKYQRMGCTEAVMKVKYQIRGDRKMIQYYKSDLDDTYESLQEYPDSDGTTGELLRENQAALHSTMHPVAKPHWMTIMEVRALKHLATAQCPHTPRLLGFTCTTLDESVDEIGMTGGYVAWILMTKLPGEPIRYEDYWRSSLEKRIEIRGAFREALIGVWAQNIYLSDSALRNLIWNDAERRCYIVDFEHYSIVKVDASSKWTDRQFVQWGLMERQGCAGGSLRV